MKETRKEYVEKWAQYVKTHTDKEWSAQQKKLIDSQIKNARKMKLSEEQVEYIKKEKRKSSK